MSKQITKPDIRPRVENSQPVRCTVTIRPGPPISSLSKEVLIERALTGHYDWHNNPMKELMGRGPLSYEDLV